MRLLPIIKDIKDFDEIGMKETLWLLFQICFCGFVLGLFVAYLIWRFY